MVLIDRGHYDRELSSKKNKILLTEIHNKYLSGIDRNFNKHILIDTIYSNIGSFR